MQALSSREEADVKTQAREEALVKCEDFVNGECGWLYSAFSCTLHRFAGSADTTRQPLMISQSGASVQRDDPSPCSGHVKISLKPGINVIRDQYVGSHL